MAKLPKKSTMIDTIDRVMGYAYKLFNKGIITSKQFYSLGDELGKLKKAIDK